jgi:hypothetical protein
MNGFPFLKRERHRPEAMYRPGDRVIYLVSKHSTHPGPRAESVQPEEHGEGYQYDVKKYWLVVQVQPNGLLTVVTRRGKQRAVAATDPRLRPARWWECLLFRSRFPQFEAAHTPPPPRSSAA